MEEQWLGRAVSIRCDDKLGVFQGIIKEASASKITVVRAFRNGVPLRKQDAEVTLKATDIYDISFIPFYDGQSTVTPTVINKPTPVKQPNFANAGNGAANEYQQQQQQEQQCGDSPEISSYSALTGPMSDMNISYNAQRRTAPTEKFPLAPSVAYAHAPQTQLYGSYHRSPPCTSNSVAQFFGNLIPPKVEVRMGAAFSSNSSTSASTGTSCNAETYNMPCLNISKPIDIDRAQGSINTQYSGHSGSLNGSGNGSGKTRNGNTGYASNGNGNGGKKQRKLRREQNMKQNQTFGSSMDDPLLHEDFDFEGNLALFDKQALWNVIDSEQKPDLVRQTLSTREKKYRHDENILESEPLELRQIETMFESSTDFVTDEGLIIPTIPIFVRSKIELSAEKCGLSLQRQTDILARGAADLAILLLGGARRLTPNNCHQWPTIAIICDKSDSFRVSNIGAATGRQLASHGLKVFLYLEEEPSIEQRSNEISLFKATDNTVVYSVEALPTPDLVILSTNSTNLSADVKTWFSENRASILAMDPPPNGISEVPIKYSILPILPLNGISSNSCGKLYLCNLGIPNKFYRDAGIKYKSPFGHKFVIPIHSKD